MTKNKFYFLIVIIFFMFSLYVLRLFFIAKENDLVFNQLKILNNNLSKKLVDNYFSAEDELRDSSITKIKQIVLKDMGYDNWLDFIQFVDIQLYLYDVVHDDKKELLISVNLSKDQGAISMYQLVGDRYILVHKIDELSHINSVSAIKTEPENRVFIILEETLDEMVGAYFVDNYTRIFTIINNDFVEVFRQSTDYSAFYFEKWSDIEVIDPKWYKITEISVVDNLTTVKNYITINVYKSLSKYEAHNPIDFADPSNNKLIEQNHHDIRYVWSKKFNYFIIAEGIIASKNESVGIIEDTTQTVDYLLNLTGEYYKVINKDGIINYIDKNDVVIIEDYSNL